MATPPVLSKVHTFAQDLEQARLSRGNIKAPTQAIGVSKQNNTIKSATAPADTKTAVKPSVQNNPLPNTPIKLTASSDRDATYPATIITDQKRHKLNLTEEMSSAIGNWWNEKVSTLKKSKKKTYSVPAIERRKGVIETATTHTGRTATVDHREIVAKLKSNTTAANHIPSQLPTIKSENTVQRKVETAPSWETESIPTKETLLTEKPVTQINLAKTTLDLDGINATESIAPSDKKTPSRPTSNNGVFVTEVITKQSKINPILPKVDELDIEEEEMGNEYDDYAEEEETATVSTVSEENYSPTSYIDQPETEPVIKASFIPPTVQSFPRITPNIPNVETPNVTPRENAFAMLQEVPAPSVPAVPSYVKATIAERKENLATNQPKTENKPRQIMYFAPYLAGGIFVLVCIGTITYFFVSGTKSIPEDENSNNTELPIYNSETTTLPNLGTVSAQLDAPNKVSLFSAISATAGIGEGLHIVTPLAHDTGLPLSTRELLSLINRQFSPSFLGTINQVRVGMYREEPVIILTVNDTSMAKGSMFQWESTMSQDLSPWFGIALRHNNNQTLTGFVDGKSNEIDVRILKDDIGTERITYGFTNSNTIVVTSDTTAFLNIADIGAIQ